MPTARPDALTVDVALTKRVMVVLPAASVVTPLSAPANAKDVIESAELT